jgi:hypothetical protein
MAFLPGGPNRICREISFLVLLFLVLLVLAALRLKGDAEISSIEIRSELPAAVEKSGEVVF